MLKETQNKTEKLIEEAIKQGIFYYPQLRKRSYSNTRQYTYFLKSPDSFGVFTDLMEDNRVTYHAKITGYLNVWIVSNQKLDFPDSLIEGYRSDYHFIKAPNQSWDTAIGRIHEMIDTFDTKEYEPTNYLNLRLHKRIHFPPEYEIMYHYFKTNSRKPLTPLMRRHKIPTDTIDQFFSNITKLFTVAVPYYPGGISTYEPWLFQIDINYEDFVIDIFSELPTTSLHFKVNNKLFCYIYGKLELIRSVTEKKDICKIQIPWIMHKLRKRGIITHEQHGLVDCYWIKPL